MKSAPKGVIVLGSAARGKAAVAIARPRGSAAGKVVLNVKGKPKTAARQVRLQGPRQAARPQARRPERERARRRARRARVRQARSLRRGGACWRSSASARRPAAELRRAQRRRRHAPAPAGQPNPAGAAARPASRACPAACAESSYVSQGDDSKSLFVGINQGCPAFTQVTVEVGATVASCEAITSEHNFTCSVVGGKAVAKGGTADMIDMPIGLTGAANCAVDAKVTFTLTAGRPSSSTSRSSTAACSPSRPVLQRQR